MDNVSAWLVIFGVSAILLVSAVLLILGSGRKFTPNRKLPQTGLAFSLIAAGILFGEARTVGYGLIAAGVLVAVLTAIRGSSKTGGEDT